MNRGIFAGKWKELKGRVKERIGKISGSRELQQEGESERVRGRIQNAVADTSHDLKKGPTDHPFVMGLIFASAVNAAPGTIVQHQPDNSGVNVRDRSIVEKTASDHGMNSTDVEITRRIRQELMKNDSLSTYAQNIKIITKNGWVTLRGPVRNEFERTIVERIAVRHAGKEAMMSEIDIAN